jgi:hypothetical protein
LEKSKLKKHQIENHVKTDKFKLKSSEDFFSTWQLKNVQRGLNPYVQLLAENAQVHQIFESEWIAPYMACDLRPVPGRIRVSRTPHKVLSILLQYACSNRLL